MCQNKTKQEAFQGTELETAQLSGFWTTNPFLFNKAPRKNPLTWSRFHQPPSRPSTHRGAAGANRGAPEVDSLQPLL